MVIGILLNSCIVTVLYIQLREISVTLSLIQRLQRFGICDFYGSPGQTHHSLTLEIAQHPGDHLPGGAQMVGDGLMGKFEDIGRFQCTFFQQKRGQPDAVCPDRIPV